MAQSSNGTVEGLTLTGAYLGLRDQKPRTKVYDDREVTYQGCDLGLRIDGQVESVGYPDRAAAEVAVDGLVQGEMVTIPVRIMHGVNPSTGPWLFYVAANSRSTSSAGFEAP